MPRVTGDEILREIVAAQLGAVTFVQNYVQLQFDIPAINVYGALRVEPGETSIRSGDVGSHDALCGSIGSRVRSVSLDARTLEIALADGPTIIASLTGELQRTRGARAYRFPTRHSRRSAR